MGRQGLDYDDVVAAIEYLQKNDINPSLTNVRAYLGTGSNSTLVKYVKQWKAENAIPENKRMGLSTEVIGMAKSIQDQINKLAIKEINAYRFENMRLKNELKDAKRTIRELKRKKR